MTTTARQICPPFHPLRSICCVPKLHLQVYYINNLHFHLINQLTVLWGSWEGGLFIRIRNMRVNLEQREYLTVLALQGGVLTFQKFGKGLNAMSDSHLALVTAVYARLL